MVMRVSRARVKLDPGDSVEEAYQESKGATFELHGSQREGYHCSSSWRRQLLLVASCRLGMLVEQWSESHHISHVQPWVLSRGILRASR